MGSCWGKQQTAGGTTTSLPSKPSDVKATDAKAHSQEKYEVQEACFGAGCYWGTEKYFIFDFQKVFPNVNGKIIGGKVGYF